MKKSREINICITTVGGLTSPDIIKACRNIRDYKVNILGIDPFEYAVGRYFCDKFEIVPYSGSDEEKFIEKLAELVKKYNINILLPCGNEDNLVISKNRYLLPDELIVLSSEYQSLKKAFDKSVVYAELSKYEELKLKFHIVNSYEEFIQKAYELGFPDKPVVIKPTSSRGGRGVYVLEDTPDKNIFSSKPYSLISKDFIQKFYALYGPKTLIIMEFLKEPFYSVYSLAKDGKNLVSICHKREWGTASQTYRGIIEYNEELEHIASKVISDFNLQYFVNMELGFSEDGNLKLFDLNPRIGASTAISHYYGFNFIEYGIKLAIGELETDIRSEAKKLFGVPKRFIRYFEVI